MAFLYSLRAARVAAAAASILLVLTFSTSAQRRRRGPVKPVPVAVEPAKCKVPNELTKEEMDAILFDHNKARKLLGLPALKWDCELADIAQTWANAGQFRHRDDPAVGENLFVSSATTEPIATVVAKWLDEKANYDPKTGNCLPGKVCTHYSQVNWRKTTLVGCGINRKAAGKWKLLVVCNYSPAGNTGGPAY